MTMDFSDIISPDGFIASLKAKNKKQALLELAERAAPVAGLEPRTIFEALVQRERLSSTGFGRGIAIPHGKFAALNKVECFFARLDTPIEFDSHDGAPVDLIFLLLGPEHASGDHLRALARISRLMREPGYLERLRSAKSASALRTILTTPSVADAAA